MGRTWCTCTAIVSAFFLFVSASGGVIEDQYEGFRIPYEVGNLTCTPIVPVSDYTAITTGLEMLGAIRAPELQRIFL